MEAEKGHSWVGRVVADWAVQPSVVSVFGRCLAGRLELERDIGQWLDRDFASLQYVGLEQAFAGASVGVGIDCRTRSVVLGQEMLGLLRKLSCRIVGIAVEELHKRHRSIGAGHKLLVGCCRYRNFRQFQLQQAHYQK